MSLGKFCLPAIFAYPISLVETQSQPVSVLNRWYLVGCERFPPRIQSSWASDSHPRAGGKRDRRALYCNASLFGTFRSYPGSPGALGASRIAPSPILSSRASGVPGGWLTNGVSRSSRSSVRKKPHLIEKWGPGTVKDDQSLAVRDSGASTAHACDYSEY